MAWIPPNTSSPRHFTPLPIPTHQPDQTRNPERSTPAVLTTPSLCSPAPPIKPNRSPI